jgi:hypothetical protein
VLSGNVYQGAEMRAFIIVVLALIASAPAMAQDDGEQTSGVRVGNQVIWSNGTVSPVFRDHDPSSSLYDSDRDSQRDRRSYNGDDSSRQSTGTAFTSDGRACRVIGGQVFGC